MLRRKVLNALRRRLRAYPAVALVGPRQCGKTTLAHSLRGHYFDLEQPRDRLRLDLEWDRLAAARTVLILDEAQSWPPLFERLRGEIDRRRRQMGRFLLLGSVSPALMVHVSESLAGRLSLLELTPFLWAELTTAAQRDRRWLCGGYPDGGILKRRQFPDWQRDYLSLLTQRDLPAWGLPAKPQTTDRLLRMLAALNGQVWNASQLGQSLGLSYHTINGYLDFLVDTYLIRRLQPFQANIRKRLVKSPKVYWRDSGLLHSLLGVAGEHTLLSQPWVGASWEGFVIEQVTGHLQASGRNFDAYYFRTSDGHEIDLLLDVGGELWAIEVKLTTAPGPGDMDRLGMVSAEVGATRHFLVSKTPQPVGDAFRASCDLSWLLSKLPLL